MNSGKKEPRIVLEKDSHVCQQTKKPNGDPSQHKWTVGDFLGQGEQGSVYQFTNESGI